MCALKSAMSGLPRAYPAWFARWSRSHPAPSRPSRRRCVAVYARGRPRRLNPCTSAPHSPPLNLGRLGLRDLCARTLVFRSLCQISSPCSPAHRPPWTGRPVVSLCGVVVRSLAFPSHPAMQALGSQRAEPVALAIVHEFRLRPSRQACRLQRITNLPLIRLRPRTMIGSEPSGLLRASHSSARLERPVVVAAISPGNSVAPACAGACRP